MKSFNLFVGLVALLPFALAVPTQAEDLVMTPAGLRPSSSVIQIPEGGSVNLTATEIHLLDASKKVIHVAQKSNKRISSFGAKGGGAAPAATGWISYAYWHRSSAPIQDFWSTWVVPPNPTTNHGQTLFLFNGVEPDPGNSILQPVLQWGPSAAGGGAFWQVSTWYVSDTTTFFTPLVNVNVGQSLQGIVQRTGQNADGSFNYLSGFAGIGSGVALNNSPEMTYAVETLEAYSISAPATDYPTGCTQFNGIGLTLTTGASSVSWSTVQDDPDNVHTTVATNGANGNGAIKICYPTP
ncbi:hypothetical protein L218DRAFT_996698 [Marasmius fiardii PR-910]|nr:hypothetical protein L218DRAFT_996698 [Marasmius fiardii PR-910]